MGDFVLVVWFDIMVGGVDFFVVYIVFGDFVDSNVVRY